MAFRVGQVVFVYQYHQYSTDAPQYAPEREGQLPVDQIEVIVGSETFTRLLYGVRCKQVYVTNPKNRAMQLMPVDQLHDKPYIWLK